MLNKNNEEYLKGYFTNHIKNISLSETRKEVLENILKYPEMAIIYMQKLDIPYFPSLWKIKCDRSKVKGVNYPPFEQYLAHMQLKTFEEQGFADSEYWIEVDKRIK